MCQPFSCSTFCCCCIFSSSATLVTSQLASPNGILSLCQVSNPAWHNLLHLSKKLNILTVVKITFITFFLFFVSADVDCLKMNYFLVVINFILIESLYNRIKRIRFYFVFFLIKEHCGYLILGLIQGCNSESRAF